MRSCVIEIDNEEYVPVRAIPYCTAGQFSPLDVACLLTDLESHADSAFSANVVPFGVNNGNLVYQAPNVLLRFRSHIESVIAAGGTYLEQVAALPPDMVVKVTDMKNFNEFLYKATISAETHWTKNHNNNYAWLDVLHMTSEEESVVFEGFEKLYVTLATKHRVNDSKLKLNKIKAALNKVESICAAADILFSTAYVPGIKQQLLNCLKHIDPSISMALGTFDGKSYVGALQLRWRQGGKSKDGDAMVAAVKLQMGVI